MRPIEGIAVDAAHSTKNKVTEYRAVNLQGESELFYKNLGNQTVNIGEFLGVVAAVKYIIENDFQPRIIYTDSMTALTWFNNKQTASLKNNKDLKKAEVFLNIMSSETDTIQVIHWKNSEWGETPADFGRK